MSHIFISYSHKDTDYAHKLADALQNKGINVWIDERLDYGSQWPHEIQKQLDTCSAFIVIMSPRSFASEWVQSELQRAKRKLKPIFPLLLEGDEPWLSVESTQYYDVRDGRMPDARFFGAISRLINLSQTAETDVSSPQYTFERGAGSGQAKPASKMSAKTLAAILGAAGVLCVCLVTGVFVFPYINPMGTARDATPFPPTPTFTELSPTFTALIPSDTPEPPTPEPPTATQVPTVTTVPPTFTPVIPTVTPRAPSPVGRWIITANGFEGELNIVTINNGRVSGKVYDNNPIEGTWNEATQKLTFTRFNSPDPNIYQIFYGEQVRDGNSYILTGYFEDYVNGNTSTYDWAAER